MGFFKKILSGVESVAHSIATTVDPHLKALENQYKSLKGKYNASRLTLIGDVNTFQSVLNDYRSMAACNGTLLISGQVLQWQDTKFNDFLAQTKNAPPFKKAELLPGDVSAFITKNTGSTHCVNFLLNPTNASSYGLGSIATTMHAGGIGNDAAAAVIANLAAFSIVGGIGGMVIGDIIAGEIEYPKEIAKLNGMYQQLLGKIGQVNGAIGTLRSAISNERQGFLKNMASLNAIQPASFDWHLPSGDTDAAYQHAMVVAIQQYGIVFRLRNDWTNFHSNKADGSYQQFVTLEKMIGNSAQYSAAQVEKFIWLIAQSTDGGLHDTWVAAGRLSPS